MTHNFIAFFGLPGGYEWIIILVVALLIFGKRLPEVGRSLGKGIVEFKKGIKGVKEEIDEVDQEVDDAAYRAETEEPAKIESKTEPDKALEGGGAGDATGERISSAYDPKPVEEK